jgi:hypothetical protein
MTEPPPIGHHRAVPYSEQELHDQSAGFAVTWAADNRSVHVLGICPCCGGRSTTIWPYGIGDGFKGLVRRRTAAAVRPSGARTVYCDCGHAHADRPADVLSRGCGAYWQVKLP